MIHWKFKPRIIVAQSLKEAGFIELALCVRNDLWIIKHRQDLLKIIHSGTRETIFYNEIGEEN